MTDDTTINNDVWRALASLERAATNDPWTDGPTDPHTSEEAYLETLHRLQSIPLTNRGDTHE